MRALAVAALALGACTPPPPFVLAETAEPLPARAVSLTLAGGAGGAGGSSTVAPAGGTIARVRVGVGHGQEVGLEGGAYFTGRPNDGAIYGVGKLSWKLQLLSHMALLAGAGVSWIGGAVGVGGDFGGVWSTGPLGGRPIRVYGGLRGTLAIPARRDPYDGGGITGGGVLSTGLAWAPTPAWRLYLEAGAIGGGSVNHGAFNAPSARDYFGWAGGYGALAVSRAWTRP